jgi:RimJ/RimL family protein N-acetyltransferase
VIDWPLFDLRLTCRDVALRPVREDDLERLATIQPDDYEHDPRAEMFAWLTTVENRRRLVHQEYWRSLGTWSPTSWYLTFAVEYGGATVGIQTLEAEAFPRLRTVDSGSWLRREVRGRGVGVAMRMAILGLAFDHLGARAAVTSADLDNAASLGVSRHIGYSDNGVTLNDAGYGVIELRHLRLTAQEWVTSGQGREVTVTGVEPCLPWFGAEVA